MVSIVIPVYNEENIIVKTIEDVMATMKKSGYKYEIIPVNDGSNDLSGERMREFEHKEIKYIEHPHNKGYGAALKSGIDAAQYDIIAITDADGTYPNEKLPELIEDVVKKKYDMSVGARIGPSCSIQPSKRLAKWILKKIAEYLAETKIPDINSGLRVFRKEVYEEFKSIIPDGFSFTTTITLASVKNGYKTNYRPIDYYKRVGHSKIHPIKDTLNFFNLIVRTVMYYNPLKVFIPLSLSMFAASFLIFLFSGLFLEKVLDTTTVVFFVTGLQILAIGMIADLIDKRLK